MNDTEQTYHVATYSYACTAYVRTTLRRALALQSRDNVWVGTEYVNAARGMVGPLGGPSEYIPDTQVWELTRTEIMTIHTALEWRKGKRDADKADTHVRHVIRAEWSFIEAEIARVARDIWHSEGKYWM
ncbi:hypothetical protein [Streptomyces ardesiacus]|uniref:hypothetical protein n=1 Tax=Streptomyces ardesiacus TaxID=285564 RepID=UPI00365CBADC